MPIKKLSGLISRCKKWREWTNSILCSCDTQHKTRMIRLETQIWGRIFAREEFCCWLTYHLIGEHQDCFQWKFPFAIVEKILKRWAQKVNYHHIVVTFNTKPVNIWDSNYNNMSKSKLDFLWTRNKESFPLKPLKRDIWYNFATKFAFWPIY